VREEGVQMRSAAAADADCVLGSTHAALRHHTKLDLALEEQRCYNSCRQQLDDETVG